MHHPLKKNMHNVMQKKNKITTYTPIASTTYTHIASTDSSPVAIKDPCMFLTNPLAMLVDVPFLANASWTTY